MKTVILAAGFGSRLWPLSTSEKPKQFQPLINNTSLLRYTYDLMSKVVSTDDLYVLTLDGLERHVYTELPDIAKDRIILVPERRNTLPHTLWALNEISENADEPVLFKSVDHYVVNPREFLSSLRTSIDKLSGRQPLHDLRLFCNEATYSANDGYAVTDKDMHVIAFKEKPSQEEYAKLKEHGAVYRSPFIYACSKSVLVSMLEQSKELLMQQALQLLQVPTTERRATFLELPMVDISHSLFQNAQHMSVSVIDYDFIDVGRFSTLYELGAKDENGNVVSGNVILGGQCTDSFIINQTTRPLVVGDTKAMVIVQAEAGSVAMPMAHVDAVGDIYKTRIHKQH